MAAGSWERVPVGAVVVKDGEEIIARAHNMVEAYASYISPCGDACNRWLVS